MFSITDRSSVVIQIINLRGEIIFNNEMNNLDPGYHKQIWDASNQSTGIYFCKILIEGKVQDIIKMVLVK